MFRRWGAALGLGTLAAVLALLSTSIGVGRELLQVFERKTFDYRMARYRGPLVEPGSALGDVVIVDIDERSLAELGQFFRWPRYYHATVIDTLSEAGVRAIGFDLLFPEPDQMPAVVADHYARTLADAAGANQEGIRRLLLALGGDRALGAAAGRAGRVFFGVSARFAETGAPEFLLPTPEIAAGARGFGHVQISPDPDGIVRRVRARISTETQEVQSLGVRLALEALGRPGAGAAPDAALPTDAQGDILLDYAGPPGSFLRISYADVLRGRFNPLVFKDRIALVGATASGLMDYFSTPFSSHFPGVEIHATLIHQLLAHRAVEPASWLQELAAPWAMAVLVSLVALCLRPVGALLSSLVVLGLYVVFCFEQFATAGVWAQVVRPGLSWMAAAVMASGYRYWTEERSKLAIKRAFARYLAPQVVEEIAARPELLGLGGDERELTIGFVDIRNFTTLAEGLSAGQLAHFLNDYLSEMTARVLTEEGTVDKYIGDAIMMLFGAPNAMADHALRASRTALGMRETVRMHQERWRGYGLQEVRVGVGLNTGIAAVGNMGSSFRFDYTAMGDSVNLASRLEGLNKVYGTEVILGPQTAAAVQGEFTCRELDFVRVKGKQEPVRIYELLGRAAAGEALPELAGLFGEGLAFFRNREWEAARRVFVRCLQVRSEDGPSHYYLKRIEEMLISPPPRDWNGISAMEEK